MNLLCPQIFMESTENYLADCGMSEGESFLVPPLGYTIFCQELSSDTTTKTTELPCVLVIILMAIKNIMALWLLSHLK